MARRASTWEGGLGDEWLLGGGCGGGPIDKGLGERMGVVWWDCCVEWLTAESNPKGDSSISSSGDSRVGIAIEECEYFIGGGSETGGSVTNAPAPMAGKVCRRGREAALARGGRRLC